jgi:AraC family transcriptional regulator
MTSPESPRAVAPAAWQIVAEVVQRLQGDLDRAWTLADAARTSGYEVHHFAHTFSAVVGEPPLSYLRRLRLERAAHQLLADAASPIARLAAAAGYASSEAFTRAFRRAFGVSPRAFRRDGTRRAGGRADAPRPHALSGSDSGSGAADAGADAADAVPVPAGLEARPRIARIGPLYGWTVLAASFDDPAAIAAALSPLLSACPPDAPWQLGGVSQPWGWVSGGTQELRLLRLMESATPPPGPPIAPWRLPAGWFAIFDYAGALDGIAPACGWIMSHWVPRSGLRAAFAPLFSLLEGTLDPANARARLHAPVEAL